MVFFCFVFLKGYELFAFISHMGTSTMSGHYVCHIKKEGRYADNNVCYLFTPFYFVDVTIKLIAENIERTVLCLSTTNNDAQL